MKHAKIFYWDILTFKGKKKKDITYPKPGNCKCPHNTQHVQKTATNFLTDFWKSTWIV